jgi:hypothetical protein
MYKVPIHARVKAADAMGSHTWDLTMTETILIEIRAAEGGDDAKLLVTDQLRAYCKAANRERL